MRDVGEVAILLSSTVLAVSQHRLFNEHLVSASSNPALAMRRKKHTEKEVHADLISIISVRLREGYSIREVNITKGEFLVLFCFVKLGQYVADLKSGSGGGAYNVHAI